MRNDMPYNYRMNRDTCAMPEKQALAMAYVPWQEWQYILDAEKGFSCGTIFKELHKPFQGMGGCCS